MATFKIIYKKDRGVPRVNSKGETVIYIQYCHDQETKLFTTGIKVLPEYFDIDIQKFRGPYSEWYDNIVRIVKGNIEKSVLDLKVKNIAPSINIVGRKKNEDLESLMIRKKFHEDELYRIRGQIKAINHKERVDLYYKDIIMNSDAYTKKTIEKSLKIKLPDTEEVRRIIKVKKEQLKLHRQIKETKS